jgi:signal transduction histidine kinase
MPASVVFTIDPPWWHTWWFYSLLVIFIGAILYAIYLMKLNQWKIRYQLRNKIARDLHDDIGSTLSGINIFSKIALQKMNTDKVASGELLQKISDRSKKTMDALSDIVWSINTKNDDMNNVLEKMQEYLSETLESQNIEYTFEVDESIRHTKLGMEVRKELYLIFKEAIYNACKYAQCTHINIFLRKKKEACILAIQDNGKGFDIDRVTPGDGIHNMKQRAAKMKAAISINSELNKGTLITLNFHIT